MTIVALGIDLDKTLCSIAGMDADGAIVMRRWVRRSTLVALAGRLAPCAATMEAWLAVGASRRAAVRGPRPRGAG